MKINAIKYGMLIAGLQISAQSFAGTELFSDEKTSVTLRGYVEGVYVNTESNDSDEINEGNSRWGLDISRKIKNGWTAGLTMEWGLNFDKNSNYTYDGSSSRPQDSTDDAMFARHGYIHFSHDDWGVIGVGKQWAVFYDVTLGTDILNVWGASASGSFNLNSDGGISGTGRTEQTLSWRQSYGQWDLGLQVQAQDEPVIFNVDEADPEYNPDLDGKEIAIIGNGFGASVIYNYDKFKFGVAHNISDIDINPEFGGSLDDDVISAGSITYGKNKAHGLYFSAMFAVSENHEVADNGQFIDAEHSELIIKYTTSDDIGYFAGFNHLEPDDSDYIGDYEFHYNFVGIEYSVLDGSTLLFAEGRFEDGTLDNGASNDDNQFAIGATFYL